MDNDRMRGNWPATKASVRQRWNKLTDADLTSIDGDREMLLDTLEQRYGDLEREDLEQQVFDFEADLVGERSRQPNR